VSSLPFPEPQLSDGVVALRPWRDEDASVKVAWGRDAVIVRWTGVPANYTEEAARARAAATEETRKAGRAVALAIVDATSGVVLGSCDIRRPDAEDPALGEVGYLQSRREDRTLFAVLPDEFVLPEKSAVAHRGGTMRLP